MDTERPDISTELRIGPARQWALRIDPRRGGNPPDERVGAFTSGPACNIAPDRIEVLFRPRGKFRPRLWRHGSLVRIEAQAALGADLVHEIVGKLARTTRVQVSDAFGNRRL
jgi:hypothetical protein